MEDWFARGRPICFELSFGIPPFNYCRMYAQMFMNLPAALQRLTFKSVMRIFEVILNVNYGCLLTWSVVWLELPAKVIKLSKLLQSDLNYSFTRFQEHLRQVVLMVSSSVIVSGSTLPVCWGSIHDNHYNNKKD